MVQIITFSKIKVKVKQWNIQEFQLFSNWGWYVANLLLLGSDWFLQIPAENNNRFNHF